MRNSVKAIGAAGVSFALLAALAASDQLVEQQHRHYKLIDMGTFGGVLSGTNFPGDANNKAYYLLHLKKMHHNFGSGGEL